MGGVHKGVHKIEFESRAHLRVEYPKRGVAGFLPMIQLSGRNCQPLNISEGGVCLNIGSDKELTAYREEVDLELLFPYDQGPHIVRAQVVGSVHWNRHLRFINIREETKVLLNIAIQPGIRGIGTRLKSNLRLTVEQGGIEEWSCPFGGSLRLHGFLTRQSEPVLEYRMPEYSVEVHMGEHPMRKATRAAQSSSYPIDLDGFDVIYLTLINIREPSARVTALVKYLQEFRPQLIENLARESIA